MQATPEPVELSLRGLTKLYGGTNVVSDLSFDCPPGRITGFLGPNGAGKSTTLRMLVGLTRPTSGTALIGGIPYRELPEPAMSVGIMLDASALHPGRTGRETCRLVAHTIGAPARRADELLEKVGLAGAAGKRVRNYSLGMRQRLGLAVALMGQPSVLVLDEPINGLDPEGIHWLRTSLRDFAAEGGTVLLSSHILNEVQATVDRLVIIDHGRCVMQGTLQELLPSRSVRIRCLDLERFSHALTEAALPFERYDDHVLVDAGTEVIAKVIATEGIPVTEMQRSDAGVERLFLELTSAPAGGS